VIEAFLEKVTCPDTGKTERWIDQINERREQFWTVLAGRLQDNTVPLRPERIIEALNRHLPTPSNVISDAGTPTPYATRYLRQRDPVSKLVIPRFFGGLGYALPAVVGAWLAAPDVRPVALFGDGSLGMSGGELETLARLQVPVVMLHFNNACFGWIKALQRVTDRHHAAEKHGAAEAGLRKTNDPTFGVDFGRYDMSRLAQVYGIRAYRVESGDELEQALAEAFALHEPVFLDIVVESIADRLPPVFSWLQKVGADPEAVDVEVDGCG
jgi:acetolactate synthase-1/2/3 large subunit